MFDVALVQLNSSEHPNQNLDQTLELIEQAALNGADFVLTPEMSDFYDTQLDRLADKAKPENDHPLLIAAGALASEHDIWLLIGSVNVKVEGGVANRSVLINSEGETVATYDKIHLFDVDISDGQVYRESEIYRAGDRRVVADLPWGRAGLSICYDLRFPTLYRHLAKQGASFLTIPAAFTETTGKAHWLPLLRSRAIETGCYVFAPAQCGTHAGGRRTYGHSLVVDPWGDILVEAGTEVGVSMAQIRPERVDEVRQMIPSLSAD